jgi:hypothetical protein
MNAGKSAAGRYAWNNPLGLEESYDHFIHDTYDKLLRSSITGNALSIGCGSDMTGEVRMDIEITPAINVLGDARFLPFKDNSFETVVIYGVLHHIPDYGLVIKEATRVSKKVIVGREPNILHPHLCLFRYYLGLGGERPLYIPNLKRLYKKEGFHLTRQYWCYGFKWIGSLTRRHSFFIKFDKIVPKYLRASWVYVFEKDNI